MRRLNENEPDRPVDGSAGRGEYSPLPGTPGHRLDRRLVLRDAVDRAGGGRRFPDLYCVIVPATSQVLTVRRPR